MLSQLHNKIKDLICVKLKSRHVSNKVYFTWIQFTEDLIIRWYCTCPNGSRTVGCCAHIAAGLWYLGYARHQPDIKLIKYWPTKIVNAADLDEMNDDDTVNIFVIEPYADIGIVAYDICAKSFNS